MGAAGALVAPIAGRVADKRGSRWVAATGMTLLAGSYLLLWFEEWARISTLLHLVALVVGVVVLDMGAQMVQVANQTRIFGLVPGAEPVEHGVYDGLLQWGGGGVGTIDDCVGALEVEWRELAGARGLSGWRGCGMCWEIARTGSRARQQPKMRCWRREEPARGALAFTALFAAPRFVRA